MLYPEKSWKIYPKTPHPHTYVALYPLPSLPWFQSSNSTFGMDKSHCPHCPRVWIREVVSKWPQFEASAVQCWKDQNDSAQARRPCHFGAAKLTWQLLANHNMFTSWQQTNEGHWQFKQSIDWPSTQGHGRGWKTCSLHSFTQTPHEGLQGCQNNCSDRIYQFSKIGPA